MLGDQTNRELGRNLAVYAVGIAFAIVGALGLVDAIAVPWLAAAIAFVLGISLVVAVHEWLDGPF